MDQYRGIFSVKKKFVQNSKYKRTIRHERGPNQSGIPPPELFGWRSLEKTEASKAQEILGKGWRRKRRHSLSVPKKTLIRLRSQEENFRISPPNKEEGSGDVSTAERNGWIEKRIGGKYGEKTRKRR